MLLHIVPGAGAYGSAILGLNFYTWAFLLFVATILATATLLLLHVGEVGATATAPSASWPTLVVIAAIVVTAANAVTTFIECGPIECPDNPVSYWLPNALRRLTRIDFSPSPCGRGKGEGAPPHPPSRITG